MLILGGPRGNHGHRVYWRTEANTTFNDEVITTSEQFQTSRKHVQANRVLSPGQADFGGVLCCVRWPQCSQEDGHQNDLVARLDNLEPLALNMRREGGLSRGGLHETNMSQTAELQLSSLVSQRL